MGFKTTYGSSSAAYKFICLILCELLLSDTKINGSGQKR